MGKFLAFIIGFTTGIAFADYPQWFFKEGREKMMEKYSKYPYADKIIILFNDGKAKMKESIDKSKEKK